MSMGEIRVVRIAPGFVSDTTLTTATPEALAWEYHEMSKSLHGMFGGNARRWRNQVAAELRGRGYTHIENIFGNIAIETE